MIFVGDDWAEDHHDVEVLDDPGDAKVLADLVRTDRHCTAPSPATARGPRRSRS